MMITYNKTDGSTGRFKLASSRHLTPDPSGNPEGEVYQTSSGLYVVQTADGNWHEWEPPVIWREKAGQAVKIV